MNKIFTKEFMSKRVSLFSYSLGVVLLTWLYVSLFPSIQAQSAALSKVLNSFGPAIKAFGVTSIGFDTVERYLSLELFGITWPILVITFVAARAGQSIAGETENGTMGTLLSLPVSRANIYLAKYFAGLAGVVAFVFVTAFASAPISLAYGISIVMSNLLALFVICLLFAWAIFSVGMMLSAFFNEKGHVYLTLSSMLIVMYVANVISGIASSMHWLQYASIFHYFNATDALVSGTTSLTSYLVFGITILVSAIVGMGWFIHKDVVV